VEGVRRLLPVQFRAWLLPLLVAAIVVPASAAFSIAGPPLGLATGALTVAVILVLAARAHYDAPIEVAASPDRRYRMLVVATEPLSDPGLIERIAAIAAEGQSLADPSADSELLVVAPARPSALDRWASDLAAARRSAGEVVAVSLGSLAAAGLDAAGHVGDADPVQAIEDELHTYPAREVLLVDGPGLGASEVAEVRRRLDRPVRELGDGTAV
jgi:hypothetical protein